MKTASKKRDERAFRAVEGLLCRMHPKADNAAVMESLRSHFGSASAMLASEAHVLERAGLHPHDALLLSKIHDLVRCSGRNSFSRHPQLGTLQRASAYLVASSHGLKVERFCMLCLDARGRLMEHVLLQEGTLDGALFSLRTLLSELMRVSPHAIILSHNHPGRTLSPSREDVDCTRCVIRALTAVGIPLLDHIIVAGGQAVSMRDNGFIPVPQWLGQAPDNRMLRSWLPCVSGPNRDR